MEQKYLEQERKVKEANYKDLGWDNGRITDTEEQKNCLLLQHNVMTSGHKFDVSGNNRGSKNIHGCNTCKWFSYYDCSD